MYVLVEFIFSVSVQLLLMTACSCACVDGPYLNPSNKLYSK